jgi:signal transduction histidine kinase
VTGRTRPGLRRLRRRGGRLPWSAARRTVRARLTLIYWSLSLVSAIVLAGITYWLTALRLGPGGAASRLAAFRHRFAEVNPSPGISSAEAHHLILQAQADRANALNTVLLVSGIGLAVMLVVSAGVGWLIADRALRPLRVMAAKARRISAVNLHERLAMDGPPDELGTLADSFDGLLERLEAAFAAQRQFAANASHELRTPVTLERSMVEVALADPDPSVASLRATCERVLAASEHQERLIEALFTLAKGQRGLDHAEPLDLAAIAAEILITRGPEAERAGLTVTTALHRARTSGDLPLSERLVDNLVANAIRHNSGHGRIEIRTGTNGTHAYLVVNNTGPVIAQDDVDRLFEPFQRLGTQRTGHHDGLGLGLPIVRAVATAHGATVTARAEPGGGLAIEVCFPLLAIDSRAAEPVAALPGPA